ncbi:hypothetical protein [Tenacibaculum aiptasiae]|uniref:hypothetical protein n=1 Tax=Tenacibaculum aiptasiae TaxID=426481 RepID=UPI00232D4D79|nr:hypothetical protein [Tenacibaculum aiptasiae]
MSVVRLLYIDDNKINSQIDNLRKKLKNVGFDLDETFLNLSNDHYKKRDEYTGKVILDKAKIQSYVNENYMNENFDIIASDYDFKDPNLDGFELLRWIKNESTSKKYRLRRAKFCLYSSEQDKVAKTFDTPKKVKSLIKLKIDEFIDRDRIPEELTKLTVTPKDTYQHKDHLIKFLEKYPNLVFNSVYPKFKGKKLSDIAHEIDKDLPNGIDFQKNLVELTIAHLVDLNKFED